MVINNYTSDFCDELIICDELMDWTIAHAYSSDFIDPRAEIRFSHDDEGLHFRTN